MTKKSGKWKVESGNAACIDCSLRATRFPFRISPFPFRLAGQFGPSRFGLTLIELLISIAIIATLSALFLGASRAAMESARASRTKTTILKIHTLIMEQWASYETRRVDLDPEVVRQINLAFPIVPGDPLSVQRNANAMADVRVLATRELMKFEMPDRWSDVDLLANYGFKLAGSRDQAAVLLKNVPTIARTYNRRYLRARDDHPIEKVNDNQGAECLFLTVMLMTGDGEARTLFSAQDIGDKDEDGLPEFLDGWGNPIEFLRWAPGFTVKSSVMSGDADADHDPFDPFRRSAIPTANPIAWPPFGSYPGAMRSYVDALRGGNIPTNGQVGFRLVPLIYSGGPDGAADIVTAREVIMSQPSGTSSGALNPYFPNNEDDNYAMGAPYSADGEDQFTDNITNHLQEGR